MVITTSALVLVGAFMMPVVPASLTKNWLNRMPTNREILPSAHQSFENELIVNEKAAVNTVTKVTTHALDNWSYALSTTTAQLDHYSKLNDGWDGEDSFAPTAAAVAFAKELLDVIPSGISVPHPMISKNGIIGFYWSSEDAFADIEIDGDRAFSIFAQQRKGDRTERYAENITLNDKVHQVLAECLSPLGRI